MKLLENSIILEKIYKAAHYETKKNLKILCEKEGIDGTIYHIVRHTQTLYPCHMCMLNLTIYYSTNCKKYMQYFPDSILEVLFKNVSCKKVNC